MGDSYNTPRVTVPTFGTLKTLPHFAPDPNMIKASGELSLCFLNSSLGRYQNVQASAVMKKTRTSIFSHEEEQSKEF